MKLLTCFVILLCLSNFSLAYDWSTNSGAGDPNDPYQISSPEQLLSIGADANLLDKHYILTSDIVFDPVNNPEHVFSDAVIGPGSSLGFSGSFEGDGKAIFNLKIAATNEEDDYIGLFGQLVDGAEVDGLMLINCQVSGTGSFIGALCGWNDAGTIIRCSSNGEVSGDGLYSRYIGGLCGFNDGLVQHCSNICDVAGDHYVGGICGYNGAGEIKDSHNAGDISGTFCSGGVCGVNESSVIRCANEGALVGSDFTDMTGGICGLNNGTLNDCLNLDSVTGRNIAGGMCGMNDGIIEKSCSAAAISTLWAGGGLCGYGEYGEIYNSLWDSDIGGLESSGGGYGVPTESMADYFLYQVIGWDMVDETINGKLESWYISGIGYPLLYWMTVDGDMDYDETVTLADVSLLVNQWLLTDADMETDGTGIQIERLIGDFNFDGNINLYDFAAIAGSFSASAQ